MEHEGFITSIYCLPLDILRLLVARYIHPLDYHRVLRCAKLFHVLNGEQRRQKEFERAEAKRTIGKRMHKRFEVRCNVCGWHRAKRPRRAHGAYFCAKVICGRDNNYGIRRAYYMQNVSMFAWHCRECLLYLSNFLCPFVQCSCGAKTQIIVIDPRCRSYDVWRWEQRCK